MKGLLTSMIYHRFEHRDPIFRPNLQRFSLAIQIYVVSFRRPRHVESAYLLLISSDSMWLCDATAVSIDVVD
jgi:hypothetical protein